MQNLGPFSGGAMFHGVLKSECNGARYFRNFTVYAYSILILVMFMN